MISIDYKIVNNEFDDFWGENGFLSLKFNDLKYGDIYSDELNDLMDTVSVFNWFERLLKVYNYLYVNDQVYLSDVDSYNIWISFKKNNSFLTVDLVSLTKDSGTKDIEFFLQSYKTVSGFSRTLKWNEFSTELLKKTGKYIDSLYKNNNDISKFDDLVALYETAVSYEAKF